MSVVGGEFVTRQDVARVLGLSHEAVDRLIDEDAMPAVRLPGRKYQRVRIYLPDLHRWLLVGARNSNSRLRDYGAFKAAFVRSRNETETMNG